MRDRLTALRKALDKETKEREAVANKAVRDVHLLYPRQLSIPVFRLLKPLEDFSFLRFSRLLYFKRKNSARPYMSSVSTPKVAGSFMLTTYLSR